MELVLRDGDVIANPANLVDWYEANVAYGPAYYRHRSSTPSDKVLLEDLGATVLFAGRPTARAAKTLAEHPPIDIASVPRDPLHELSSTDRQQIVDAIVKLIKLGAGFQSALATKLLHKKRPHAIPVLDNLAIFATFMVPDWHPGTTLPKGAPVKDPTRIGLALDAIYREVSRDQNQATWSQLEHSFGSASAGVPARTGYTRIELLDMIWWSQIHRTRARA